MLLKIHKAVFRHPDQKQIYISCNKCCVFRVLRSIKHKCYVHYTICIVQSLRRWNCGAEVQYIDRVLTNALIQMLRLDKILESLPHEFKV